MLTLRNGDIFVARSVNFSQRYSPGEQKLFFLKVSMIFALDSVAVQTQIYQKKVSEYDQETPQSHTEDQLMAP